MRIRVLLVDDHQVVREGLRALLEEQNDGFEVVGDAGDGLAAVELAGSLGPDVVIMDISLPRLGGIEVIRRLRSLRPPAGILVLSMYSDPRLVRAALDAGALAYMLKEDAFDELVRAVRKVAAGGRYLSPGIDLESVEGRSGEGRRLASLTRRERQILALVAEGGGTRAIAESLGISAKTVETHRRNLMSKLDLYTVADLTKFAVRHGLTPLDGELPPRV